MKCLCYVLSAFLVFATLSAVLAKAPETPKVVFTSRRDGNFEIYIMNPDGSDQINLTQHRAKDASPVWSPTGEQILFTSDRGGIEDLYLMDADGTNVRQVFKKLIGREFPTWSPDGKALAYQRFHTFSIYTASIDGKDEKNYGLMACVVLPTVLRKPLWRQFAWADKEISESRTSGSRLSIYKRM